MMRVKGVFRPADYPGTPDAETAQGLATLFATLRPCDPDPEIDRGHAGIAVAAHNPAMALKLGDLGRFLALDTGWGKRIALRELALQTVNRHFGSTYSMEARRAAANAAGIDDHQLAALADRQASPSFDEEQCLVIAYTQAVVTGDVPAPLFADVVARYGEREAIEFTTIVGFWSAWAMILQATCPDFDIAP